MQIRWVNNIQNEELLKNSLRMEYLFRMYRWERKFDQAKSEVKYTNNSGSYRIIKTIEEEQKRYESCHNTNGRICLLYTSRCV